MHELRQGSPCLQPSKAASPKSTLESGDQTTLVAMKYDPFVRGPHPVGVRSAVVEDASRGDRRLEVELWYPAADRHAGEDLSPQLQDRYTIFGSQQVTQAALRDAEAAPGNFPLIVFSHGMAGHRRQSTFFCTHLASHGYLVVSPDHGGNTIADLVALVLRVRAEGGQPDIEQLLESYVFDRPRDVEAVLDALASGALSSPTGYDKTRVGVAGHSFGGFTALVSAARDERVVSVLALAPAGGNGPLASAALRNELTLDFAGRPVASLYLALERDTLLPLSGIESLYQATPRPSVMFTLPDADHMHFCDRAEQSHEFFRSLPRYGLYGDLLAKLPRFAELVPEAHGHAFANALGVAHADATLKDIEPSRRFLSEAVAAFGERGIAIRRLSV